MTRTKPNATAEDRPAYVPPMVFGLTAASVILELQNIAVYGLAKSDHLNFIGVLNSATVATIFVCSMIAGLFGKEGVVGSFIGVMLALFIETRFRGAGLRLGTFDFFDRSMTGWTYPVIAAGWLGALLGGSLSLFKRRSAPEPAGALWLWGIVAGLGGAALLTAVATLRWGAGNISEFAPTKHFALAVLCLFSAASIFLHRRSFREES